MALVRLVRECDLFRKVPVEQQEATEVPEKAPVLALRGVSLLLILVLALSETRTFLTPVHKQRFDLDRGEVAPGPDGIPPGTGPKKLRVLLDVTVHGFPCVDLSLDYQDIMGTRAVDVRSTIFKQRLHPNGSAVGEVLANDPKATVEGGPSNPSLHRGQQNATCKSCFGALPEGECCNTCSDVIYAYRLKRWALPRIEDIEQCRHDGTAQPTYQPPQLLRLGDYSPEEYMPKFTKMSALTSVSGKEPRITTPFRLNLTGAVPPLKSLTGASKPAWLNFTSGWGPGGDENGGDDSAEGDAATSTGGSSGSSNASWPGCTQRNTLIHGYDFGEALMVDLATHGAKEGCWNNDCTETDKFTCASMESCSTMCRKVASCHWWTWGDEDGAKKCWLRSSRSRAEKRYGFASGARGCFNSSSETSSQPVDPTPSSQKSEASSTTRSSSSSSPTSSTSQKSSSSASKIPSPRWSSYDDDEGWGGSPYALSFPSSPHMPLFGHFGYESKESQMRKQQKGESCRMYGYFDTNKVPGHFHIGAHGTLTPSYLSYFDEPAPLDQNMRHTINSLAFVEVTSNRTLTANQPLDGFESPKAFTFQYYIMVTPATRHERNGSSFDTYQFRAGSFVTNELLGPAIFFRLDLEPIRVTYYTEEVRWSRFLVNLCAVVGGCIALSAMLAQLLEVAMS